MSTTFLAELRETWRLKRAWKHLCADAPDDPYEAPQWTVMDGFSNPVGYLWLAVWRSLPYGVVACIVQGAVVAAGAWILAACGFIAGEEEGSLIAGWPALSTGVVIAIDSVAIIVGLQLLNGAVALASRGLHPTSFEVLRLPSRRAWLVACWAPALAAMAGIGVLVALCWWVYNGMPSPIEQAARLCLLTLLPLVVGLGLGAAKTAPLRKGSVEACQGIVAIVGFVLLILGFNLDPSVGQAWVLPAAVVGLCALFAAAVCWAVASREPWALMNPKAQVGRASAFRRTRRVVEPLAWMRGRHGLYLSAMYADLRHWQSSGGNLMVHLFGVAFAFLAFVNEGGRYLITNTPTDRITATYLGAFGFAVCCLLAQPLRFRGEEMTSQASERLMYMYGVEASAVHRFRWRTMLVSPLLLLGVVLTLVVGVTAERVSILAVAAGALLYRAGWTDHPLRSYKRRYSRGLILASVWLAVLGGSYLVGPGGNFLFAAAAVLVPTFVMIFCVAESSVISNFGLTLVSVSILGSGALGYVAYRLVSSAPLVTDWLWTAAGLFAVIGLMGAIDQRLSCDEASLRERLRRDDK